ncbi:hypothetical protein HEK616_58830 [Streptomyces nigrescens]|uniref:Secreted protein n=1 Tax=Streptomyces nigrescens TaxID=1920 RepID=A0ABM8A184_STRNI|nr:hypothetical protein HEK616_58830 [Streptomyces nigrescens]
MSAVVTGVLDVMCAMGVVGVALVTGMADVAHAGNRDGLRRRPPREHAAGIRSAGGSVGRSVGATHASAVPVRGDER